MEKFPTSLEWKLESAASRIGSLNLHGISHKDGLNIKIGNLCRIGINRVGHLNNNRIGFCQGGIRLDLLRLYRLYLSCLCRQHRQPVPNVAPQTNLVDIAMCPKVEVNEVTIECGIPCDCLQCVSQDDEALAVTRSRARLKAPLDWEE